MMMTVKQASERLSVSVATVYSLVGSGKLACHRVGLGRGTIRISEADIEAYLERCRNGAAPVQPARRTKRTFKHLRT